MLFNIERDEEWVDISGYEGCYKINKLGQVMRVGGQVKTKRGSLQSYSDKILKPYQGQVYLSKDGKVSTLRVCNLMAQTFFREYVKGQKVYHIEGDSDALDNLSLTLPTKTLQDDMWKDIPGYEGYYQASKDGQIRSLDREVSMKRYNNDSSIIKKGKVLSQHVGQDGYMHVMLSVDGQSKMWSVHRLLALTFLPNADNKPQVNHIDGNKTNNLISNLEWVTASENMVHAKNHDLWDPKECGAASTSRVGIRVRCITDNREFESINKAAQFYNMDFASVRDSIDLNRPRKGKQFEIIEGK